MQVALIANSLLPSSLNQSLMVIRLGEVYGADLSVFRYHLPRGLDPSDSHLGVFVPCKLVAYKHAEEAR